MQNPLTIRDPNSWMSASPGEAKPQTAGDASGSPPRVLQYGVSLLLVAVATGLGLLFEDRVGAPNLALIFVLPVIGAATWYGWGPSLLATGAGVLAFDFFFTEPKYSLTMASPADVWAAALLLAVAIIVSAVAAESRRREQESRRAAEQALALQTLAHAVIQSAPRGEIAAAAANALNQIFHAPSVIFMRRAGVFQPIARAGGARITAAEVEAAGAVLESGARARADSYPHHKSSFDFWPVATARMGDCVIGVGSPSAGRARVTAPERFIDIVGAYLAVALERPADAPRARGA